MAFTGDSIFWVEVEKIVPNPFQPRREFDEAKLRELAESVRMYGILQPLTVTRKEIERDDGAFYTEYELIAGERRLRASRLAGLQQVPVIIRDGEQNEQEKLELAIIENLQREDLNAVDRALAFKQLAEAFQLSHGKVAKKVGRSREYVSNSIRLLALPEHMLDSLKRGELSEGHARTLLMLSDKPEELDTLYREILLKKLSVREVERIARKIANDKVRSKKYKDVDPELIEYEKKFTETLGTRVQILKTEFGGKLTIDYFSEDDLSKLFELIAREGSAIRITHTPQGDTVVSEQSPAAAALQTLTENTPLTPADAPTPIADDAYNEPVADEPMVTNDGYAEPVPAEAPLVSPATEGESVTIADASVYREAHDAPAPQEPTTPYSSYQSPVAPLSPEPESPAESATPESPNPIAEQPTSQPPTRTDDDDSDLYAIRNFGV